MSLLGGILSRVVVLANNLGVAGAAGSILLDDVRKDFTVVVSGTALPGFDLRFEGSLDNTNWFGIGYIGNTGVFRYLGYPVVYVRANMITAPTSGSVTVTAVGD